MLASITPLGERSRGFAWGWTASAFAVGAVASGTLPELVQAQVVAAPDAVPPRLR